MSYLQKVKAEINNQAKKTATMPKNCTSTKRKRHISFLRRILMLIFLFSLISERGFSQESKLVRGTVTSASSGSPLQGVNIRVKGTQRGTVSDEDGKFSIQAQTNEVLVLSFVGLKTQEIKVGTNTVINVTMAGNETSLDDVVVIGYGSVRKKDLTGAVGTVNVKELAKAPVASFAEALAGRVAGVQVVSTDGQPGAGVNITIRGPGSLTQSTTPLYVIDGIPVENPDPATLNTEEIESLTILKDASSTAIFGSRAANGVVLIQTKRGKSGEPIVDFSSQIGFQATPEKMELMSPYEFIKYQRELNPTLATTAAFFANGKTLESYSGVEGLDLQDYLFRTGVVQSYNLALRGGNDKTKYSVSGAYFDQQGAIVNTGLSRYSGRVTLDQTVSNRVKAGATVNYSGIRQNGQVINQGQVAQNNPTSFVLATAWMYRPISPFSHNNLLEDPVDGEANATLSDVRINPLISQKNQHTINQTNLIDANAYITLDITKDLFFKTTGGIRHNKYNSEVFYNSFTAQASPYNLNNQNGIFGSIRNTWTTNFTNTNTLNYTKTFAGKHTVTGLGLFEVSKQQTSIDGYGGRLLPNENLGVNGLEEGVAYNAVSSRSKSTVVSYATRWDYSYASKYLITATFRADGSSKFINNKWGYFPSVAVAWNMHNEKFLRGLNPVLSSSKLRIGYGATGNNRIADFAAYPSITYDNAVNGYPFNNSAGAGGAYISNVGNVDLQWETIKTLDIGYEVGFLNNRITLEADIYRRITSDLLLQAPLPPTTGFASAVKNIGELKNEGLEFTLNTVNINNRLFKWQTSFNISFNRNEITALNEGQRNLPSITPYVSQFGQPLYLAEVGKPAGMMIGYIWLGNYQYADFDNPAPGVYILKPEVPGNGAIRNTIQPGDIKYKDLNGDGTMTSADVTFIGRGQPIHTGGISNNFSYKGFDLNVFFQWSYGNDIYNANRLLLEGNSNGYANINQFASYANRWSPENQTNENYRTRGQGPIGFHSSRVVEDGSFLRLKTVSLGYNIPSTILKKVKFKSIGLFVSAQNLVTWTKYSGLDPEVSVRSTVAGGVNGSVLTPGYDYSSYPKSPVVTFGLRGSF